MTATHPNTGLKAAIAIGLAASLAANVLAAEPTWIGATVAAWPPIALFIAVEIQTRYRITPGWPAVTRLAVVGLVAGAAAWVSYWHMVEVALNAGEGQVSAMLYPLFVDGVIIAASITYAKRTEVEASPEFETSPDVAKPEAPQVTAPTTNDDCDLEDTPVVLTAVETDGAWTKAQTIAYMIAHPNETDAHYIERSGKSERSIRRYRDEGLAA